MTGWFSIYPEPDDYTPSGVMIDGAVYPLDGQPPVAVSQGWGDMSWLRRLFPWRW